MVLHPPVLQVCALVLATACGQQATSERDAGAEFDTGIGTDAGDDRLTG